MSDVSSESARAVGVEHRCPASYEQARLVRRENSFTDVRSGAPHFVRRFGPDVDLPALGAALEALTARHEPLRTTFVTGPDGAVEQVIHPASPVELPVRRLDGEVGQARERLAAAVREEVLRPFDLAAEPVLRIRLYAIGEDHYLLLVVHHIAIDRWSHGVFMAELGELYRAHRHKQTPDLPEICFHYRDYAAWQQARWESGGFDEHRAYWRAKLADLPPAVRVPADRPRPGKGPLPAGGISIALPRSCAEGVSAAARTLRAGESVVLLAAFLLALARWTGQERVMVGSPVANRPLPETEKLVGLFVNMVLVKARPEPGETFRAFVQRLRGDVFDAYDYQDLFLEKAVESVPEAARGDLARIVFAYDDATISLWDAAPFGEPVPIYVDGPVHYDLAMVIQRTGDGITGGVNYPAVMFDDATVQRFLDDFAALVEQVGKDLDGMVVELGWPQDGRDRPRTERVPR